MATMNDLWAAYQKVAEIAYSDELHLIHMELSLDGSGSLVVEGARRAFWESLDSGVDEIDKFVKGLSDNG